jgi:hypothetical protein
MCSWSSHLLCQLRIGMEYHADIIMGGVPFSSNWYKIIGNGFLPCGEYTHTYTHAHTHNSTHTHTTEAAAAAAVTGVALTRLGASLGPLANRRSRVVDATEPAPTVAARTVCWRVLQHGS